MDETESECEICGEKMDAIDLIYCDLIDEVYCETCELAHINKCDEEYHGNIV